jgi:hypothetical protein
MSFIVVSGQSSPKPELLKQSCGPGVAAVTAVLAVLFLLAVAARPGASSAGASVIAGAGAIER